MCMRTTLSIDDDVLAAARERARATGTSVGRVLSDLARRGLVGEPGAPRTTSSSDLPGFVPLPSRGGVVSNELIDRLRDEEGV